MVKSSPTASDGFEDLTVSPEIKTDASRFSTSQRILKAVASIGFLLLASNLALLALQQPQGYAINIYDALPRTFIPSLVVAYLIGAMLLLGGNRLNKRLGLLMLVMTHLMILLVPYLLGYYSMGRGDDMTYIGEYLHIAGSGHIASWDIYPAGLVFGSVLSLVTNLQANIVSFIVPIIFSFIFIIGLILCCKLLSPGGRYVDIAILSSFVLYIGPYNFLNTPNALFFAFLPIFIYVVFKYVMNRNFPIAVVLLVLTWLMPFTHPFIFLFAFVLLLALIILGPFLRRFGDLDYRKLVSPLAIMTTAFLTWFISNDMLINDFRSNYVKFLSSTAESVVGKTSDKLSLISLDLSNLSRLLLFYYGRYLLPLVVIGVALLWIMYKRRSISQETKNKFKLLVVLYSIYLSVEAFLLFNPFVSHQPDRITNLNFIVFAQVPLFAYALYLFFPSFRTSKHVATNLIVVLLILTSIWGISLYGAFDSPNTFKPNAALTVNEVAGMHWLYGSRDNTTVSAPVSQLDRFHELFNDQGVDVEVPISDHLGYNTTEISFANATLGEGNQTYVVLFTLDRLLYQDVPGYSGIARFVQNDFNRFNWDPTVEKLYVGANIAIYHSAR
jgi:hypothetical protein